MGELFDMFTLMVLLSFLFFYMLILGVGCITGVIQDGLGGMLG